MLDDPQLSGPGQAGKGYIDGLGLRVEPRQEGIRLVDGATWLLDISLPADKAPLMATCAAADQVALFVLQES